MNKTDYSNLEKIIQLPDGQAHICAVKNIKVIDENTFLLDNRKVIREYRKLTRDYSGWFKSFFTGKLVLNAGKIENYQLESMKDSCNWIYTGYPY